MSMMESSGLLKLTVLGVNMKFDQQEKVAVRVAVMEQLRQPMDYEQLVKEVCELRFRVAQLTKSNSDYGWQTNPDRMGGAYSQDEINNAYAWK